MTVKYVPTDRPSRIPPICAELIGSDTCTAAGITATAQAPALALCRELIAAGLDPDRALEVFRRGQLAFRIRSIGEGAGLTVEDRPGGGKPPRFIRHRPMPDRAEGSPPIASAGNSEHPVREAAE